MANIIVVDHDLSINLGEGLLEHGFQIGYGLRRLSITKGVYKSKHIAVYQPGSSGWPLGLFRSKPELVGVIDLRDDMNWKVYHFNHSDNRRLVTFLEEFVEDRVAIEFEALGVDKIFKVDDYHPLAGYTSDIDVLALGH